MKWLAIILILSFVDSAIAQDKPGVKLIGKAKGNTIILRWAPGDANTWAVANKMGYQIERYKIAIGKTLVKPEKQILNPAPLRPEPLERWKADETNDFSAVAAEAIYGTSFEARFSKLDNMADVVNKTRELDQRFSFALFSADHSFTTAKLSGLAFIDTTAKKDERYLYRVYVKTSVDQKLKLDTGLLYLGLQDSVGLTAPSNLKVQFGDRIARLQWPRRFVENQYVSFIVERASAKDGVFNRTKLIPFINVASDDPYFQATDSLPLNEVEYLYRIRGITPFGETGPESERVNGIGYKSLDAQINISEARELRNQVQLQWKVTGNLKLIAGFDVERSSSDSGPYRSVNKERLRSAQLEYLDPSPGTTNYYRVKAIGNNNQQITSFPRLVQLADSIPPASPTGLKIAVDTTGLIKLSWSKNKESDFLGYRVYRSNFSASEFSLISTSPVINESFIDSLGLDRLDKRVFYKLSALDKRYNPSGYSEIVPIELPDRQPPVAPIIKSVKSVSGGNQIEWIESSSEDVISHELCRRQKSTEKWIAVKTFSNEDSSTYTDKIKLEGEIQYSMVAVDQKGLKSNYSNVIFLRKSTKTPPPIENLTAEVNRDEKGILLKWTYQTADVSKFMIYRSTNNEPMTLYKTIASSSRNFKDRDLEINTIYRYSIRVLFKDGKEGGFSMFVTQHY